MSVLDILIKSLRSYIFILLAAKVFDGCIYAKPHGIMLSVFLLSVFFLVMQSDKLKSLVMNI